MKQNRRRLLAVLASALLLTACTLPGVRPVEPEVPARAAVPSKQAEPEPPTKTDAIRRHMQKKDYTAALKRIRRAVAAGTEEKELAPLYLQALHAVIKKGEARLAENAPAEAGLFFRAALDGYPECPALASKAALPKSALASRISCCADRIMEKGLLVYREGNLDRAIELWKEILAFAPDHQASRSAIRTAATQRANLERIDGGKTPAAGKQP
jgi:tetratricopeptide (TPR) repeat protein